MVLLTSLPNDLLIMLPEYMRNIEDFMNASSSCRKLRSAFADTNRNTILRLAAASSRVFFRPDPYFLVMATAGEIGRWGLKSLQNTNVLRAAMRKGIDGLNQLCVAKCGLTMDDIRRLHSARFDLINPAADMIDKMAGAQWYATPNFWNGGVSEPYTIHCDPERNLFQFLIYGELFGSTMDACLQPTLGLPRYSVDTRLDYVRYCIPDDTCYEGTAGLPWPQRDGPYATPQNHTDGIALHYVLACGRWNRAWQGVRSACVPHLPDFDDIWRQGLWENSIQYQGLAGLEMLRPGGPEKWRNRIQELYYQIEQLSDAQAPAARSFGESGNMAYESPGLGCELYICVCAHWGFSEVIDPWVLNQDNQNNIEPYPLNIDPWIVSTDLGE